MVVYSVLEIFGVANMTISFFFLSPLSNFIGNPVVFKITISLCLSFLSHSNNEFEIRSTAFQEDSCGCDIFAGLAISAPLQKSILDMLWFDSFSLYVRQRTITEIKSRIKTQHKSLLRIRLEFAPVLFDFFYRSCIWFATNGEPSTCFLALCNMT